MTKSEIEKFFKARPSLSKAGLCREADITPQYLNMILREARPLTDDTAKKLKPVMELYGW